jgi:hypothetical protein
MILGKPKKDSDVSKHQDLELFRWNVTCLHCAHCQASRKLFPRKNLSSLFHLNLTGHCYLNWRRCFENESPFQIFPAKKMNRLLWAWIRQLKGLPWKFQKNPPRLQNYSLNKTWLFGCEDAILEPLFLPQLHPRNRGLIAEVSRSQSSDFWINNYLQLWRWPSRLERFLSREK